MLSQHSKKRDAGAPNIVPDPLVDPGNPSHRYQALSTAHLDRPCSRMVALAASSPSRRSPRPPQTKNATVMLESGKLSRICYIVVSECLQPILTADMQQRCFPVELCKGLCGRGKRLTPRMSRWKFLVLSGTLSRR